LAAVPEERTPAGSERGVLAGPLRVAEGIDLSDPVAIANFATNRFPRDPAEMQATLETYYTEMGELARRLLSGFALALGVEENWFDGKVDKHISNVRLAHYPAQEGEVPAGAIRAGEHTDYGCLTILLTDDSPGGLEVKVHGGGWEAVPHVPGSFVVNIGDLMAQWSNDRYVSTAHRVANPPSGTTRPRLSVAFFHQPNYDAVIDCLPGCSSPQNPPRYAPTTSGAHRLSKLYKASQVKVA
jgi:isopenicillin N synthase-like dioxygenase